jgi:sulfite reductase alpha subunit-like flavoprotein
MYLIFGCRQEEMDFHYHEEWQTLADKGVLKVYTAFSRDPQNPRYVQHAVEGLPNLVRRVIAADGIFFVCGGSPKMAIEVQNRVLGIMRAAGMARSRADLAQLNWHEEIW